MLQAPTVCCAGEVMIELVPTGSAGLLRQGCAGDTLNTAVYLRRAGLPVRYLTALGDDIFSEHILSFLRAERIDTRDIRRCPGRQPGLYAIHNDAGGERHFSYWRSESPVRQLFDTPLTLAGVEVFYFSGITLAVCRSGQRHLLALLRELHEQGCRIVFDPNFRPVLWDSLPQARAHYREVLPLCDIVLPTLDDDRLLWDCDTVASCREFHQSMGVKTVVIKSPDLVVHAFSPIDSCSLAAPPVEAVDTTGAGDAFAAGFLAAQLRQQGGLRDAILAGQALAARVVRHRGAILSEKPVP
jgi:2-dehydro-3-deoxygluconokinase